MIKKDKIFNIIKLITALTIFLIAVLNYKTLSTLDIRVLIAGTSTIIAAEMIILGVYIIKAILLVLPASLIYISVGMAFDWKRAVIINLIGITIEVTLTYFLGKFLGKNEVEKRISKTKYGQKLIKLQDKYKNLGVFIIRFLPIFPIDFSSLFMGAFDFSFPLYLLLSVLGIAPRVIAFTILGDGIYELIPMKFIVLAVIIMFPIAIIIALIKKNKKKTEIS